MFDYINLKRCYLPKASRDHLHDSTVNLRAAMSQTQRFEERNYNPTSYFFCEERAEVLKRVDFFVGIQRIFGFAGKMLDMDFEPQIRHTPTRCKPDHAISSPFPIEIQASPTFRSYSSPIRSSNTLIQDINSMIFVLNVQKLIR
ncbi:hypothetical protein MKW98_026965 [Papaver atlanticum]|uniref:Uncharacterized protein n=1 Tax=Papaver atlanticum TaxID=357466 RepID=A0AAD4SWP0_9MAGN|nr:hypothetical protein MKW98_026965 [Papaver atlanticum]